ncbi:hypothetical protein ACOSQ2_025007 [Xanthoceras sorbifolium]
MKSSVALFKRMQHKSKRERDTHTQTKNISASLFFVLTPKPSGTRDFFCMREKGYYKELKEVESSREFLGSDQNFMLPRI